jgi:hypothetical protein
MLTEFSFTVLRFFSWGGTYVTRYCGHFWPIVQPQMIDGGDCGAIGGMKITFFATINIIKARLMNRSE